MSSRKRRQVVLTNGWSFLADRVRARLQADGYRVRVVPRPDPALHLLGPPKKGAGRGSSTTDLVAAVSGVQAVVFTIAEPFSFLEWNRAESLLAGVEGLAGVAAGSGAQALVVASSSYVSGPMRGVIDHRVEPIPDTPYARLMVAAEDRVVRAARSFGVRVVTLRLPHVYGVGSPLLDHLASGRLALTGDLSTVTSHLHVEDAARAISRLIESPLDGRFQLADSMPAPWDEVLDFLTAKIARLEVHLLATAHRDRAERWLDDRVAPMPSAITPGTGWGWSCDQEIDASEAWDALEIGPRYPTYRHGFDAVLAEAGLANSWPVPAGEHARSAG